MHTVQKIDQTATFFAYIVHIFNLIVQNLGLEDREYMPGSIKSGLSNLFDITVFNTINSCKFITFEYVGNPQRKKPYWDYDDLSAFTELFKFVRVEFVYKYVDSLPVVQHVSFAIEGFVRNGPELIMEQFGNSQKYRIDIVKIFSMLAYHTKIPNDVSKFRNYHVDQLEIVVNEDVICTSDILED